MTLRIVAGIVFLGWSFAFAGLNAAEPGSDISASAPTSFTRPSADGHPLPVREGSQSPAVMTPKPTTLDSWHDEFSSQLDESLSRMRTDMGKRPNGLLAVTWGVKGEASSRDRMEAVRVDLGMGNQPAMIAGLLQERGLPSGLTSVVAVESAFNPLALSPKGARGLWQLMPSTARRYGLTVGPNEDERTNPFKSTNAAAAYLKDLFAQFRDWPLVLAAYNAGEDRVARAMARTGASDFWTLSRHSALPQETLQYVPTVLEKLQGPMGAPETGTLRSPIPSSEKRPFADRIAYATPAVRGN